MARYDLYPGLGRSEYVLDVQADLLSDLNTRIVVPLLNPADAPEPARGLNPTFSIGGSDYVMMTQFLAAVPCSQLKTPVGNLSNHHDEIMNAVDMIFLGF